MSKEEIEELLLKAVERLQLLETRNQDKVKSMEDRIEYLEEMLSSQKNMLADSLQYIRDLKAKKEKV